MHLSKYPIFARSYHTVIYKIWQFAALAHCFASDWDVVFCSVLHQVAGSNAVQWFEISAARW